MKRLSAAASVAVVLVAATHFALGRATAFADTMPPTGLMLNLMARPELVAIADPKPRFSWIVNSPESDNVQTAYQILLASDGSVLAEDRADVWDSGKVRSRSSTSVEFGGNPLASNRSYGWKVRTWDKKDAVSPWSSVQLFRAGQVVADPLREHFTPRYPLERTEIAPLRMIEKGPGHYFIDFGRDAFAALRLHYVGNASARVTVHMGEMLGPDNTVNRRPYNIFIRYHKAELDLKPGDRWYTPALREKDARRMPPEIGPVMPFRYCEIEGYPGKLAAEAIRQVAVHYLFDDKAARFTSSDATLNAVWELCKYSVKATSFCGVYVDGDRERLPYEADAYIGQLGHYCCDREFTLDRYSYEYLLTHPTWPTEYQMISVLQAWADYMHTADPTSLRANYEVLKAKTLIGLAREDGSIQRGVSPSQPRSPQVDSLRLDPRYGRLARIRARRLCLQADQRGHQRLALSRPGFDEPHRRGRWKTGRGNGLPQPGGQSGQDVQRKIYDATVRYHREQGGLYVDGEGTDHVSLFANMYAAAADLVPPDRMPRVVDCLVGKDMACSVFGAQALMEALYHNGEGDHALKLLTSQTRRSWHAMLEAGSTITLEAWNPLYKDTEDWNHIWGAAPANVIPNLLMGIEPLEPGFAAMRMRPQPGRLEHASLDLPTIRGTVHEDFRSSSDRFVLQVILPANTTAEVDLPDLGSGDLGVMVDGVARQAKRDGRFLVVDAVGSGSHHFERTEK